MVAKSPYEAIQLLEFGRGIIAASPNKLRADIFDLQQKHPLLAEDYISLRDQLDAPDCRSTSDKAFPCLLGYDHYHVDRDCSLYPEIMRCKVCFSIEYFAFSGYCFVDLIEGRTHQPKLGWHMFRNAVQAELHKPVTERQTFRKTFFQKAP